MTVKIKRSWQRPFSDDLQDPVGDQFLVDGRGPEVRIWKSVVTDESVFAVEKCLSDDHLPKDKERLFRGFGFGLKTFIFVVFNHFFYLNSINTFAHSKLRQVTNQSLRSILTTCL